jgi:hypothetical protein
MVPTSPAVSITSMKSALCAIPQKISTSCKRISSTKIPPMIQAKGRWHSSLFVVAIMPVQGGTFVPADGMKNQDRNVSWFLTMAKE